MTRTGDDAGAALRDAVPGTDGFEIRPLRTRAELIACTQLQRLVWGVAFSEIVPPSLLLATQRAGGVAAGAFAPDGTLVGFVFGIPGIEHGRPIHWSDMLAVRADLRDRHLGERLKRWQRLDALRRGVRRMYWSFDPLESRNAYFNLRRLGARVREYYRDMYGETDSPLHAGIGTDRLIPVWELDSPRVIRRLAGEDHPPTATDVGHIPVVNPPIPATFPVPSEPDLAIDAPLVRIAIPANIQLLKEAAPDLARAWRETTRAALEGYFARGYVAEEVTRHGDWSTYLLRAAADEPL
ncbi:MAG: hypothetical protein IRZ00_02770 [Gemmatimonadetes bacterium]|nr:hypothetical protein [Gemmatimonadota bacterium]